MKNVRLPLTYEAAVFSSSSVSFIPLPTKKTNKKDKKKAPKFLVLFHLFPELYGYLFLSLDFS